MLAIDVMDRFQNLVGADPRRFIELPSTELEEIVDALDGQIDVTDDAYDREILSEVQHYALMVLENRGDDEPLGTGRPVVTLLGTDGNAFAIIGTAKRVLADADWDAGTDHASQYVIRALAAKSYDQLLQLTMEYCDVR